MWNEKLNSSDNALSLSRSYSLNPAITRLGSLCRNMDVNYDEDSAHRADYVLACSTSLATHARHADKTKS